MHNKIISIHQLRGFAVIFVILFHFRSYLNEVYTQKDLGNILFGSGAFGVDLFFMISGFIIVASTEKRITAAQFIIRRFFRVYPTFIFVFIIGILSAYNSEPLEKLLRSLLLIHKDYSKPSPGFGYNTLGPAWTLTYELYFYFIFSISLIVSRENRVLISSILITLPLVIIQLYVTGSITLAGTGAIQIPSETTLYGVIRFISSPILIEFVIGMFLYTLYHKVEHMRNSYSGIILFLCIGIFFTFYFTPRDYDIANFGMDGYGFWSLFLMIGFLQYEKSTHFSGLESLNFLGDISYSLYISHYLIINILNHYHPDFWINLTGLSKIIFIVTFCISVACIIHYFIEKPSIRIGKMLEFKLKNN
ncbi:acyltransferase [Mangrovibacter phragmitis]|uniref:Acyltransferase n=1 Tax=Mangrovibacter phragmitis TaxID=1691903 RepID=A0A1B7LA84_9ENTR|nr:acyltransferase [Mangrovibacter phragmitis]OAT79245.1 acyltransferase [Mangrovibacter phragmitis]